MSLLCRIVLTSPSAKSTPYYPKNNTAIPAQTKPAQQGTVTKAVPAETFKAGAGKAVAFSGASLAGLLALAAYVL